MKGITEIELTNVRTGEKEKYTETNLVTNAIADFFSHNIDGMLFTINGNTNDLNGNMLPLCPNGIGGILLFSDTIEENPDRYYAPSANPCVGYASNDVNDTTNVMRGSMNLTETKRLDNGYKFVWDFTTSQANGTISCVALTHKWGGLAYMGDTYNGTNFVWTMRSRNGESSGQARTAYINAVEIDPEKAVHLLVSGDGETWTDTACLDALLGASLNESSFAILNEKLYVFCRGYDARGYMAVLDADGKPLAGRAFTEADGIRQTGRPKLFVRDGVLFGKIVFTP